MLPQRLSGSLGERAPARALTGVFTSPLVCGPTHPSMKAGAAHRAGVPNVHLGAETARRCGLSLLGAGEVCFYVKEK